MPGSTLVLTAVAIAFQLVPAAGGWIVAAAALFGASVDTLVGALRQSLRWCRSCEWGTEQRRHSGGTETRHQGGCRWLGNDAVNFVCTASAAALPWLKARLLTTSLPYVRRERRVASRLHQGSVCRLGALGFQ